MSFLPFGPPAPAGSVHHPHHPRMSPRARDPGIQLARLAHLRAAAAAEQSPGAVAAPSPRSAPADGTTAAVILARAGQPATDAKRGLQQGDTLPPPLPGVATVPAAASVEETSKACARCSLLHSELAAARSELDQVALLLLSERRRAEDAEARFRGLARTIGATPPGGDGLALVAAAAAGGLLHSTLADAASFAALKAERDREREREQAFLSMDLAALRASSEFYRTQQQVTAATGLLDATPVVRPHCPTSPSTSPVTSTPVAVANLGVTAPVPAASAFRSPSVKDAEQVRQNQDQDEKAAKVSVKANKSKNVAIEAEQKGGEIVAFAQEGQVKKEAGRIIDAVTGIKEAGNPSKNDCVSHAHTQAVASPNMSGHKRKAEKNDVPSPSPTAPSGLAAVAAAAAAASAASAASSSAMMAMGSVETASAPPDTSAKMPRYETVTPGGIISSSSSSRRGDPRMNRAVAAKLADPSTTLLDALLDGGFVFPLSHGSSLGGDGHDSSFRGVGMNDKSIVDAEGVSLYQRKNQLNRRLRRAKVERAQRDVTSGGRDAVSALGQGSSPAGALSGTVARV